MASKESELGIFSEYKASVIHLLAVSVGRTMPGGQFLRVVEEGVRAMTQ